jgi:hypothetical protein
VGYSARTGNLAEGGDSDWWMVTFTKSKNCSYKPKIVLSAGSLPIYMRVFPACSSGAGTGRYACKEANPAFSDANIQTYEVEAFADCGYQATQDTSSYNVEYSATDGFFEEALPQVTYVRVFATGSSSTCLNYSLVFSN